MEKKKEETKSVIIPQETIAPLQQPPKQSQQPPQPQEETQEVSKMVQTEAPKRYKETREKSRQPKRSETTESTPQIDQSKWNNSERRSTSKPKSRGQIKYMEVESPSDEKPEILPTATPQSTPIPTEVKKEEESIKSTEGGLERRRKYSTERKTKPYSSTSSSTMDDTVQVVQKGKHYFIKIGEQLIRAQV